MPSGRKPLGEQALSNAARQARHCARHVLPPVTAITRIGELLVLQAGYADWLTALPDSLRDTAMAVALEAIVDLDLTAIAECEPPRGYGRD